MPPPPSPPIKDDLRKHSKRGEKFLSLHVLPFETHGDATRATNDQASNKKKEFSTRSLFTTKEEEHDTSSAVRHPESSLSLVLSPSRDAFSEKCAFSRGSSVVV